MAFVGIDVAQTRINLHPEKSLRQLSSSRLANRRIHAYHSVIAMSLLHPALLMLTLFIMLRIRLMKFDGGATNHFSSSCQEAGPAPEEVVKNAGLPLTEEMALLLCVVEVISFLLVVIRQRLLLSGDVELNPGPLDDIEVILYSVDDTTFEEDDWNDVIKECSSLAAKWEQLSGYLGLSIGTIETIKKNFPNNAAGCWNEALKQWILQNYRTVRFGLPSWRTLLEAVARVDKLLFKNLADKHRDNNISTPRDDMELASGTREALIQVDGAHAASEMDTEHDQESAVAPAFVYKPTFTFPCLDLTKLSKEEKQHLHQRLYTESMDMTRKFQNLFSATTKSLKKQKVSVKTLICHLIGLGPVLPTYEDLELPPFRRQLPELRNTKTIEYAMLVIGDYCSFFNYHMIEHIINKLGTRRDKKSLTKYKEEFARYAERHVFECPSEVGSVSDDLVNMIVTLDQTFEGCTVRNLELFMDDIRKILNISTGAIFKLYHVAPGSLRLSFQLSPSLLQDVFPLSDEKKSSLASLDITELSCEGYVYQFKVEIPQDHEVKGIVESMADLHVEKPDDTSSIADSALGTSSIITVATMTGVSQFSEDLMLRDLSDEPYLIMEAKLGPPDDSSGLELHQAAYRGELDRVKKLIQENELNPLLVDKNGDNALHYTAEGGHLPVMKYLIEEQGLNPACLGAKSKTPLHYAAVYKHLELVKFLIGEQHMDPLCQDEDGYTPLHLACQGGDIDVIQYLISEMKKHISLDSIVYDRTKTGNTAVHIAALKGHLSVVKLFITELNFDPNTPGRWSRPPLVHTAQGGHLNVVRYFIEELHCDPSYAPGEDKATPLHMAAVGGHLDVIRYLILNRRCSPLVRNSHGNTPLHYAAGISQYETVKFFISELNCDPNTPGQWGGTPLHLASQEGHLNIVQYLIDMRKCNPASLDDRKVTPLHLASGKGHLHIVKYLIEEKHCNPLCYDRVLGTPLHWAARDGQLEIVKYLVDTCKCPVNIRGAYRNMTPLELARYKGHTNVVQYLSPQV